MEAEQLEEPRFTKADLEKLGREWMEKIQAAEKREEAWIKNATNAEAAYSMDEDAHEGALPSFNILFSNVETIVPSLYNSTPTPDIRPRHNAQDPLAKSISELLERAISFQIDDNALDAEIESQTQDAFMAGRGVVRVRFEADEEAGQIFNERVLYECVSWRDYREGSAKRWENVPWVAYCHDISASEKDRLEDDDIASMRDEDEVDEERDCKLWEIWEKEARLVYLVTEDGAVVSIKDDPLQLPGFFPQAQPVQPITLTGKRNPICPYTIYKKLAEELDTATQRINKIMKGLKVRGIIAANGEAIDLLAAAGDNELITVADIENLVAAGGLERAVMWWPVDQAIAVLQQLYVQREATKAAIYEVTGISDIVRGASSAAETATAQQIKSEWGSLRIKKMQRLIERQIRDLFVLTSEIISRHFSIQTLQEVAGIQIVPEAVQLLRKPLDHYRIDVESDSTIRADLTKSRGEMSEFLQGTAQFFNTMAPLIAQAPESASPLAKMYASFARQFNLGKSAEDALDQFIQMAEQAGQQPQKNPEQEKVQAEMQAAMQKFQAEMAHKAKELAQKERDSLRKHSVDMAKVNIEADRVGLDEAKGEVDALARVADVDLKLDQDRPL